MKKVLIVLISALFTMSIYTGCSKSQMAGFQGNDQEPAYSLLRLFEGFPALNSLVESLDSQKLNNGLGDMMINGYETPLFLRDAVGLIEAPFLVPMINELHGVLNIMTDTTNVYHYDDPDTSDGGYYDGTNGSIDRLAQFYAALDMVVTNTDLGGDVLAIAEQVVDYLVTEKTAQEIESDMGNMMKVRFHDNTMYDETNSALYIDLPVGTYSSSTLGAHAAAISSISVPIGIKVTLYDADNQSGNSLELTSSDRCLTDNGTNWDNRIRSVKIEYDITKLAKLAGKVTMSCDYPMWVNGSNVPATNRDDANSGAYTTNTDLGNAAKGVIKLLYGLNTIAASDETVRATIDAMILEDLPALLNADANATTKIENAIVNMSNYFAADEIGTSTYESSTDYHNTDLSTGYVNASFKETLRDMLPTLVKLFIRNDGTGSADYSIINADKQSPIESLMVGLGKLKAAGIDYSNSANALEPTLKRTMQYNGRMKSRTDDSAWSQMSYLDHLVYTIGSAYSFGYLTRTSASGEGGYTNFNYGHGIATNGVITVNDSMFALTSKDASGAIMGCDIGMDSYALALGKRTTQANHISRSISTFDYSGRGSHKFYLGYDYPTMLLLPSNCAGDAGIPNGGETGISVTTDTTNTNAADLAANNYRNDYRTYWPKVADGKGVLNTSQFLMGWVPRVAWDGQGPYYSTTYTNDSTHPATMSYTMPVNGRKTVNVYYKPNGEVYAYVYKPSTSPSSWEYFYPNSTQTGLGDDIADPDDSNGQRANRYKDKVISDYYMIEHSGGKLLDTFWKDSYYNVPPMNENGTGYVAGISGSNKYTLKAMWDEDYSTNPAKQFKLYERIGEYQETSTGTGVSVRECATQEEAMFRNIQWFLFEKKFVFIIPMWIDAAVGGIHLNYGGAFILIEANGAVGLANAKKGSANGRWIKLGSEGIPATTYNSNYGNNPDYGDSNIPGDGRITVFCRSVALGIATIDATFLFNNVLGDGYVLPDAVGRNIEPVSRMAFLTENATDSDIVLSDDRTSKWDNAWVYRNRLVPLLAALVGVLHDGTKYVTAGFGYNYNYSPATPHKYPIGDLLEGILIPLGKPMLRRFNTADTGSSPRWVPRVKSESGATFAYLRANVAGFGYTPTINNYIPRDTLRTPISVLTGNSASGYDGVLPMMADGGGMVTRLLGLLQLLGSDTYAEPRANIALGLEQVMTAAKFNKSEAITNGYFTTLDFSKYEWMFNKRNEDLDLEDFLGYEGEYRVSGANWSSFEDTVDMLKSFVGGSRNITQNLVNITNAVLAQQLTEDQVHGLLYTAGKLFARYNQLYPAGAWQYHGYDHGPGKTDSYDQLVDVLTYLPQVHETMKSSDGSGVKYDRLLKNVDYLLKNDNSILHTIIEDMTTPYSAQAVIEDLGRFLSWSIVSDPNSPLWDDLVLMLDAMADMNDPRVDINVIIKNLGFQSN